MTKGISVGGTPIAGLYVGSTPASAVYVGSTKVWPAGVTYADVAYVGATGTASASTSGTGTLTLPAGAAVGDVVVVGMSGDTQSASMSGPSGSVNVYGPTGFGVDGETAQALVYRLASGDITTGSIAVSVSNPSENWTLIGGVFRHVSTSPLDVVGTLNSTSSTSSTYNITANSITPTKNGDAIIFQACPDVSASGTGTFGAAPTGFTKIADNIHTWSDQSMSYMLQSTAAATGSVTQTYTNASSGAWGANLFALRKAVPAFSITTTLASTLVNGVSISATVTATAVDGATGPVTISATNLPSGLTLGSTTGSGPWSASITGTPTTNDTYDVVFTATGSVTSTLDESVTVQNFGVLTPAFDGWNGTYKSSQSLASGHDVEVDDFVVIGCTWSGSANISSITDADGSFTVTTKGGNTSRGDNVCFAYRKITGAHTSYAPTVTLSETSDEFSAEIYVLRGATFTFDSSSYKTGYNDFTDTALSLSLATASKAFAVAVGADEYAGQGAMSFTPAGLTVDRTDSATLAAAHVLSTGSISETVTIDDPGSANSGYNRIFGAVAAFNYT